MRRKRRGVAKNETSIRTTRMAKEDDQEGKIGKSEVVTKLGEDESLLLRRMKRQLVGSER